MNHWTQLTLARRGRATMFTYLDDARAALAGVADEVFTVRADG